MLTDEEREALLAAGVDPDQPGQAPPAPEPTAEEAAAIRDATAPAPAPTRPAPARPQPPRTTVGETWAMHAPNAALLGTTPHLAGQVMDEWQPTTPASVARGDTTNLGRTLTHALSPLGPMRTGYQALQAAGLFPETPNAQAQVEQGLAQTATEHPGHAIGANLVGGTVPALLTGPMGAAGRGVQSAVGGGMGAVQGAASAPAGASWQQRATYGAAGAALGAGIPAAAGVAGAALRSTPGQVGMALIGGRFGHAARVGGAGLGRWLGRQSAEEAVLATPAVQQSRAALFRAQANQAEARAAALRDIAQPAPTPPGPPPPLPAQRQNPLGFARTEPQAPAPMVDPADVVGPLPATGRGTVRQGRGAQPAPSAVDAVMGSGTPRPASNTGDVRALARQASEQVEANPLPTQVRPRPGPNAPGIMAPPAPVRMRPVTPETIARASALDAKAGLLRAQAAALDALATPATVARSVGRQVAALAAGSGLTAAVGGLGRAITTNWQRMLNDPDARAAARDGD